MVFVRWVVKGNDIGGWSDSNERSDREGGQQEDTEREMGGKKNKGGKGKADASGAATTASSSGGGAAANSGGNNNVKTGVAKADARVTPEKSRAGPIENFYTVGSLLSPE